MAAVVLFHFPTRSVMPGGLFGVDVFFVLSGFLVTAGLMDEWSDQRAIRVGRFLAKRAWRLVPALLAVLVVFLVLASLFRNSSWFSSDPFGSVIGAPLPLGRAIKGVLAALLYVYNFLLAGRLPTSMPLGHLWTLAIEGQFYVACVLFMRFVLRREPRALFPTLITMVAVSACVPWLIWRHGMGANAIYFGTAPRLQQLLLGSAVALLWREHWFDRVPPAALRAAGAAGGAGLLAMCLTLTNTRFKYLGAETVTAVASAAVLVLLVTVGPAALSSRMLGFGPLTWLGRRSYGVYLWHWPMAVWTNPIPHRLGVPLGIGASLVLAEVSWRLLERPTQKWAQRRRRARDGSPAATSGPARQPVAQVPDELAAGLGPR